MKKWEIAVILIFFSIFVVLFFSAGQQWKAGVPKTAKDLKVGERSEVGDFVIWPNPPLVSDYLSISFNDNGGKIVDSKNYKAGDGWKFIILDITLSNHADKAGTFSTWLLEDENGMTYYAYNLEYPEIQGTPYHSIYQYEGFPFIDLPSNTTKSVSVAYKIPVNAVPEKLRYSIYNSEMQFGKIILNK